MKIKLLTRLAALLLASSTVFASWGVSVGVGSPRPYYAPRANVYVGAAPVYRPWRTYYAPPAPYYGAVWFPGRWSYGARGRCWVNGYWGHR